MSARSVHTIVTHARPHLDELAAFHLLKTRGTDCYPGITKAAIEEFDPGVHLDGRSEDQWLGDGYLFIGVRGGRFDDQPARAFSQRLRVHARPPRLRIT